MLDELVRAGLELARAAMMDLSACERFTVSVLSLSVTSLTMRALG